jgi:hypothetical protein
LICTESEYLFILVVDISRDKGSKSSGNKFQCYLAIITEIWRRPNRDDITSFFF